jgi:hypothetical protein
MQRDRVLAGIGAGLIAGVVFGVMMQMMTAPTPEGARMPMMAMVANVVRSDSMLVGWLYHLFNSAVIGAIFGGIAVTSAATGAGSAGARCMARRGGSSAGSCSCPSFSACRRSHR